MKSITHIISLNKGCLICFEDKTSKHISISSNSLIQMLLFKEHRNLKENNLLTKKMIGNLYYLPVVYSNFILQPFPTKQQKKKDYINLFHVKNYKINYQGVELEFTNNNTYQSIISEKSLNNYFTMNFKLYIRMKTNFQSYY